MTLTPSPQASARIALGLAAFVVVVGSFQIGRPGYSVDEEFTEFAVRGIHQHGLPILPSGLLYDRGLAYSYAAALVNGRVVSLISAALSVFVVFALVRRVAGHLAGLAAAVFVATSVPFWATATTARFYAPFLLVYLAFLACLTHRTFWVPMFVVALLARLTHELGFTIAAIPLVCMLLASGDRKHWLKATLVTTAGLGAGQLLLFALHALEPSSGETMVRQFFLWQVLNLFERPGDRQFMIPIVVMLIAIVLSPKRAWWWVVSSLSIAAMILAFSIARASNTAPLSIELVTSVLREGSRYPLDMFWHIVRAWPVIVLAPLTTLLFRAKYGDWPPIHRATHALWVGWVLWFGVIDSGITTNYLLLPVSLLLMAVAIDVASMPLARKGEALPGAVVPRNSAIMLVFLWMLAIPEQWFDEGAFEAARPTIAIAGIEDIRDSLQPNDRVVCTDELGCLMLVGRIDRWLALDDFVRERFLVRRGTSGGTGVYTGVPAIFRPAEVFSPNADGTLPDRTIVIDIFKDYPIGNSRSWLPKAIEEDGLQVTPLLETPQGRVLQVAPPERVAKATALALHHKHLQP